MNKWESEVEFDDYRIPRAFHRDVESATFARYEKTVVQTLRANALRP